MDDPHFRQRHPNAPPPPPYPSAPPHPSACPYPDQTNRLYPDLHSETSPGDATSSPPPPPPGFHSFQTPPFGGDGGGGGGGFYPPPPPSYGAPRRPPSICEVIRGKIALVVIGVLLFAAGIGVTFWNEGRTVKRTKSLNEGLSLVTELTPRERDGRITVSHELTDSLVHVTTRLSVPQPVTDPYFNLVVHAAKMKRVVEMLQWVETEHRREVTNENGETMTESSYDYTQEWRSSLVHSLSFNSPGHRNPDKFPLEAQIFTAEKVFAGPFVLSPALLSKMDWWHDFAISHLHAHSLPMGSKRVGNWIYFGDSVRPMVGDWRVSFSVAGRGDPINAEPVSIIGKQSVVEGGDVTLTDFSTSNGDVIDFVYEGEKNKEEIFANENKQNLLTAWMMRGGGWLLLFIGVLSLSDLVTSLFSGIPLLRDVVAMTSVTFALVVSGSTSLLIVAVGWFVYRPTFALILVGVAAAPFVVAKWRRGRRER